MFFQSTLHSVFFNSVYSSDLSLPRKFSLYTPRKFKYKTKSFTAILRNKSVLPLNYIKKAEEEGSEKIPGFEVRKPEFKSLLPLTIWALFSSAVN